MSNPISVYWSREKKIRLIQEYKARPVIWDKKDTYYHFKSIQRAKAWKEIATIMNSTAATCMIKIQNLTTRFKQTQDKMLRRGKDISDSGEWVVYKELMFLRDYITTRKRTKFPTDEKDQPSPETTVGTESTITSSSFKVNNEAKKITKNQNAPERTLSKTPKLFLEIRKGVVKPVAKTMIMHEMHSVKKSDRTPMLVPKPETATSNQVVLKPVTATSNQVVLKPLTATYNQVVQKPETAISNQVFMPKLVPIVKKRKLEENQPIAGPSEDTLESNVMTSFAEFVAKKMKNYSENNKKIVQHEIIQAILRADERDSREKSNNYRTEQSVLSITPDLPNTDEDNMSDESDSEPASPGFKTESITEMINENDDLFEIHENKVDVFNEIERNEQFEHDNVQFEDVEYLDEHAFTDANESEVNIKGEMEEIDDEHYIV